MKVLFLNPSRAGRGNIPINIPLLISILKKNNHKVALFDMSDYDIFDDKSYEAMFFKNAELNINEVIVDRRNFYKNTFGDVVSGCELKRSDYSEDFEKILNRFKPDIIAVSCLSTDFRFVCNFLLPLKKKYKIPILLGGIHAILLPEEVLNSGVCDFVCIGEGENSIVKLLSALESNNPLESVKGIWFNKGDKIIKNSMETLTDMSTLPILDFEYFDPIHFRRPFDGKTYKMLNYELSRGCPFNCTYCVNGVLKERYKGLGRYHRVKLAKQSIEELKFLINKYNFNFIRFWDEDFTSIDKNYLKEYVEMYLNQINLPFLIYARVDTVTEEKVQLLKKMGCKTFAMAIESGSEFIRKNVMKRNMSNKMIIKKFHLVKSYGIRVSAYNMIGLPYETRENIFETIELNRKTGADSFSVTLLEPYKGLPIRKICEKQGLDPGYEAGWVGTPQFVPKNMTSNELRGLFRTFPFYIRFSKKRWDEIKLAETDDRIYQKLCIEFGGMK